MRIAVVRESLTEEEVRKEFGDDTIVIHSDESGAAVLASSRRSAGRSRAQQILREIIEKVLTLTESDKPLEKIRVILEISDSYLRDDAENLLLDAKEYLSGRLDDYKEDGIFLSYDFWMCSSENDWKRLE